MVIFSQAFQSTRPRGARRSTYQLMGDTTPVSIHAPARGATWFTTKVTRSYSVSIHAPARGATYFLVIHKHQRVLFQSTRPRGARRRHAVCRASPVVVSIHAPARGATQTARKTRQAVSFQSTRPRGARLPIADCLLADAFKVSIHAPARGATSF